MKCWTIQHVEWWKGQTGPTLRAEWARADKAFGVSSKASVCEVSPVHYDVGMDWAPYISIDADVLAGKPHVRGTRISVEQVLSHLGNGWTTELLLEQYPTLTLEGIRACVAFAAEYLGSERMAIVRE